MCGFLICEGNVSLFRYVEAGRSLESRGVVRRSNYVHGYGIFHTSLPISSNKPSEYRQPFGLEGNKVFVGEVFNWEELRSDATHEINAIDMGIDWNQAEGFWAYAEAQHDGIYAMCDYLSQKQVYYRTDMEAVSSEPYALSLLKPTGFDEKHFKNLTAYDNKSCWRHIKRLPPGHELKYIKGSPTVKKYFDWTQVPTMDLYDAMLRSVSYRLRGHRKVGLLLSGGLDSSIVHKLIKHIGCPVESFTMDSEEKEFAKFVDPNVKVINATSHPAESIRAYQSPLDLGSVKPQMDLAKALFEQNLNVVLTGDGADELFGGYSRAKLADTQRDDVFGELAYYHNERLDRVMMNQTVECRCPFLSAPIVKFAFSLPYAERTSKQVLKKLAKEIGVHESIIARNKQPLKSDSILRQGSDFVSQNNVEIFKEIFNESN